MSDDVMFLLFFDIAFKNHLYGNDWFIGRENWITLGNTIDLMLVIDKPYQTQQLYRVQHKYSCT